MTNRAKWALVLGGYAAALLAAATAWWWQGLWRRADPASAGMQAFGDALLAAGVFGALSLVPTGLAVWLLRPAVRRWALAVAALLALAGAGLAALVLPGALR